MTDHTDDTPPVTGEGEQKSTGEVIHFNPWRDFNDAPLQEDPFGVEPGTGRVRHEFEVAMVDGQLSGDVRLLVTDRQAIVKSAGYELLSGKPNAPPGRMMGEEVTVRNRSEGAVE